MRNVAREMILSWRHLLIAGLLASALCRMAYADSSDDQEAIRQRFQEWVVAFNGKNSAAVCDLFAPDLVYSLPEVLQGTREQLCGNLERLFKRADLHVHYDPPTIHEILVSGDLAVVRLTWTLTAEAKGARDTTTEEGIDIFYRQADGRWSIARFIAFTTRQNKILQ